MCWSKIECSIDKARTVEILVFAPHSRLFSFHKPVTHLTVRTLFCSNWLIILITTTIWSPVLSLSWSKRDGIKSLVLTKLILEVALEPHLKTLWEGTFSPFLWVLVLLFATAKYYFFITSPHPAKNSSQLSGILFNWVCVGTWFVSFVRSAN